MAEEKEKTTTKEEAPEWVKDLQTAITDLPSRLKEALSPERSPESPTQDPPPQNQPVEIVLPQQPEPEPQPEPEQVTEPEQEPKKKRNFLGWLL